MRSSDQKPTEKLDADIFNTEMEMFELCVDELAHVAGGAIDTYLKIGALKGE